MNRTNFVLAGLFLGWAACVAAAETSSEQLEEGFRSPPGAARPFVWWHWLDGNITEEGIKLDLEWMQRAGIGGVQIFDGSLARTTVIPERVAYMSAQWQDAFRYAVGLARSQGMEIGIPTAAGWSETGAPFVQPGDGMKKFVWSETIVPGGKRFVGILPAPPSNNGPFQDAPQAAEPAGTGKTERGATLYRDARVVAYRMPADDVALPEPRVSTADGVINDVKLADGHIAEKLRVPFPTPQTPAWIRLDYAKAVTVRSATLALAPTMGLWLNPSYTISIESSDDGRTFRRAAEFQMGNFMQRTASFPAVSGRVFRILVAAPVAMRAPWTAPAPGAIVFDVLGHDSAKTLPISQVALNCETRIERAEEKAGFGTVDDYYAAATSSAAAGSIASTSDVIDLTARMTAEGKLDWIPPRGTWRIVRLGWSLTGKRNGPASPEGTGLEVDKLSARRVAAYMRTYLDQFATAFGAADLPHAGLGATMSDSIEAGYSNWTEDILDQFEARRGYDPTPYLPALTGHLIGSAAVSDAFLFDFRRTIGDLISEAHYGEVARAAHDQGMIAYGESLESARVSLGDDMAMRSHADVPTAAMWDFDNEGPRPSAIADVRGAASIAHLEGRPIIAAESMTTAFQPWAGSPRDLKRVVDAEFVNGVNRVLIHSSVHQPLIDKPPGLTLLIFGQYFNRNDTWAEQARAWTDYIARTSYLLQQGRYVADVALFYGEEAPLVSLYADKLNPDAPTHYGYDYVDADSLLKLLSVKDGMLISPGGARYRVLQLGGSSQRMSLPVLRKLRDLVLQGATIVGEKPVATPSLGDDPHEFAQIAAALWSGQTGKGRVLSGQPIESALANLGVTPDHEVVGPGESTLAFLHRGLDSGELWFVSHSGTDAMTSEIAFRTSGRAPELWDAETGAVTPLDYRVDQGRTLVKLDLAPAGSAIVLFRAPATVPQRVTTSPKLVAESSLDRDWTIRFQPNRGAPADDLPMALGSWSDNSRPEIRYFSGTATYTRTINVARVAPGRHMVLDLGDVRDIAEVAVNSQLLRTLWKPPYRLDITAALKSGRNQLSVKVTNLWVNRLIGDAQPDANKITTTFFPTYRPDAPLRPSGLIGPVRLIELRDAAAGKKAG